MAFGMWMVRAKMWACTGFTRDLGASYFSVFSPDGAVNGILRFVLGNLEVHTRGRYPVVPCASGTRASANGANIRSRWGSAGRSRCWRRAWAGLERSGAPSHGHRCHGPVGVEGGRA